MIVTIEGRPVTVERGQMVWDPAMGARSCPSCHLMSLRGFRKANGVRRWFCRTGCGWFSQRQIETVVADE